MQKEDEEALTKDMQKEDEEALTKDHRRAVIVKTLTGHKISMIRAGTDSIMSVMQDAAERWKLNISELRLVHRGFVLSSDDTLAACGSQDEVVLHLVFRLHGSGCNSSKAVACCSKQPQELAAINKLPPVASSLQAHSVLTSLKIGDLRRQALGLGAVEQEVDDALEQTAQRESLIRLVKSKQARPCRRFYVSCLPPDCTQAMLTDRFREYGEVESADIKSTRNCGYIQFAGESTLDIKILEQSEFKMSGTQLEVRICSPQADAPEVHFGVEVDDNNERVKVAEGLASKGFTARWLLSFWRKFGERPPVVTTRRRILQPAPGEWLGRISRSATTNDLVRDFVIPETATKKCCYMDLVPNTAVKPEKLVSHWWGANFLGDVLCILQDATGLSGDFLQWYIDHDLTPDEKPLPNNVLLKTYWMCTFAVNQHLSICGMCSDCNVVSTGSSCSVCHVKLYNPCSCGSTKYKTGHVLCQMDRFDVVMAHMDKGLAVALDSEVKTLERVWVLSEIGKSLEMEKEQGREIISWQMPNEIHDRFCGRENVSMSSIRHCNASLPADKDRILRQIENSVGIEGFDESVKNRVVPIIYKYALIKLARQPNSDDGVRLMLSRRADPNADAGAGRSVLFEAASGNNLGVVKQLLAAQANIDTQDCVGFTPTLISAQNGHVQVVQHLLRAKADFDKPDNNGTTPLFMAASDGHAVVVETLLAAGANSESSWNGQTALYNAAQNGHTSVVQSLITANADVNRATPDGVTPLYFSVQEGHSEIVQSLVAAKADVNRPLSIGTTPLYTAREKGHQTIIQILQAAGALQ